MAHINLDLIKTHEDVIKAFNKLLNKSIEIGKPICLNTETSTFLELYYHEDYPNRILVDKYLSNLKRKCPRCGNLLAPSDVLGYEYVCHYCDENFYSCEVSEEEWNGSNVIMLSE